MMLTTSLGYLQALREEKYLQFLQWPEFVIQKYQIQGADDLVSLLIYEWMRNGYCEEDAKKLALLCAVEEKDQTLRLDPVNVGAEDYLNNKPVLPGKLSYVLANLCIVVLNCMVLEANNLQHIASVINTDVSRLMESCIKTIGSSKYQQDLSDQQIVFQSWVLSANPQSMDVITQAIKEITGPRYILELYLITLANDTNNDPFKIPRISEVQKLAKYMNEQSALTTQVLETMQSSVSAIRELQPAVYEEEYLNSLVPLPFFDNTLRTLLKYGLGFFSILEVTTEDASATAANKKIG